MDVLDFIDEVDALGCYEELIPEIPSPPRQNLYLRNIRNITDPYEFYNDEDFRDRFRFRKSTVRKLIVPLLHPGDHQSQRGLPIPIEIQTAIALRYYATGSFQVNIGDLNYVSQPTVSRIVTNISHQLAQKVDKVVKFPENMSDVAREFEEKPQDRYPGLKHIIGAIGCTHVKINRPRGIEHWEVYRNGKGQFSINVQAVAGQSRKIYNVVARWPGSMHDSRIFRNSRLHAQLEAGQRQGVLVGHSGYRSTHYMLTPFINPTTRPQNNYNYVQERTRHAVESTFGELKSRFECLRVGIATKLSTASAIIVACSVLHNIAIDANEESYLDPAYHESEPIPAQFHAASGLAYRNTIVRQYYSYTS